jgi:hypothetical protein
LLAELGVVVAQSDRALRRHCRDACLRETLRVMLLELLEGLLDHWRVVLERI